MFDADDEDDDQHHEFDDLPVLECVKDHDYAAKWGPGDFYDDIAEGVRQALTRGSDCEWTTGWYGAKKEIVSARLSSKGGELHLEVSVTDDLDTPGYQCGTLPHTTDLDEICERFNAVWEEAGEDQKGNRLYYGFSVLQWVEVCVAGTKHTRPVWVETLILPKDDGEFMDTPPGDEYHKWGFQGDRQLSLKVRTALLDWANRWIAGETQETQFRTGRWIVKPWSDD
jgi:hypothetical protein